MIKSAVFFLSLLVGVTASAQFRDGGWQDLNDSEVVKAMKEQVGYLSSAALEGRKAGSEGERAAAEYVSEVLLSYGVDVLSGDGGEVFGIRQENGDTLESRNVIGFIPGYDPEMRDKYIVIGARLDNLGTSTVTVDGESRQKIFYGANGNASGLTLLMQLARKLSTNSVLLKRSVLLVAFGSSVDLCAGSWYFLNRSFPDVENIDAMVNLDMLGTPSNGFYAYTASNVDLSKFSELIRYIFCIHRTTYFCQIFCIGIIGTTLSSCSGKFIEYQPFSKECRTPFFKGFRIHRIISCAYIRRKHSGILKRTTYFQF